MHYVTSSCLLGGDAHCVAEPGGQTAEARKTLSEDKKKEMLASLSLRRLCTRIAIAKLGTLYRDHEQEAGSIRRVI